MASDPLRKLDATSYHVAWICAVADVELIPALLMLDESHERPDIDNRYDDNIYRFGTMAGHNVVVATCPDGMIGQVNVGHIAGPLFRTFTSIRMTLLVGIGGGVPQKHLFSQPLKDVRLGDVVVGWPSYADGKPAVIYYDAGRSLVNGFQTTSQLNRPHMVLLKAPICQNGPYARQIEFPHLSGETSTPR
jgi:nucleoside phosphorylase